MINLELVRANQWTYVRALGSMDDWEESDIADLVDEAKKSGLTTLLCDVRDVDGEVGLKQALGMFYVLRERLGGVRLAYVMSDKFVVPHGLLDQIAGIHNTPIRTFRSVMAAMRWLGRESRRPVVPPIAELRNLQRRRQVAKKQAIQSDGQRQPQHGPDCVASQADA